jgi:hypothetical protein
MDWNRHHRPVMLFVNRLVQTKQSIMLNEVEAYGKDAMLDCSK